MPATIIGRPECKEEIWEALKRHIVRSRQKKKEEQEADAEEARIRREKVQQQNQDQLTLEETRQKIHNICMDLCKLKAKKRQLFNELKRVLHEDEIRKKNLNKESEHKTPPKMGYQEVPQESRTNHPAPIYIFTPSVHDHRTGNVKRTRSPSPPDARMHYQQAPYPPKSYQTQPMMGHEAEGRPVGIDPEYEEPRPRFGGERAVLWNKSTGPVKFEPFLEPIPYQNNMPAPSHFGYLTQPLLTPLSSVPPDKQAADSDREKERERERDREREREREQREREKEREREREREREQRERETPPKVTNAGGPPQPANVQYLNQPHPGAPPSQASYAALLVPAPNIHYTAFQQTPQGLKPVKAACITSTPVTLVGPGNSAYPVHPPGVTAQPTRSFVPPPLLPTQQTGNIAVYASSPSSRHIYSPGGPPHNPPRHSSQPTSIPVSHPSGHISHPPSHQNSHPTILQRRAPRPPYELVPLTQVHPSSHLTHSPHPPQLSNNGYMERKDIREYKIQVVTGREQGKFPNGTGER